MSDITAYGGRDHSNSQDWNLMVSFGPSTSVNYRRAITLAQMSSEYVESLDENNKPVHQAFYTGSHNDFLNYLQLYEVVKDWKSTHLFINGNLVDKKAMSTINYCDG